MQEGLFNPCVAISRGGIDPEAGGVVCGLQQGCPSAWLCVPCSAAAEPVPPAPGTARVPLQTQLPGGWISPAALPGTPVREWGSSLGLVQGYRAGGRDPAGQGG